MNQPPIATPGAFQIAVQTLGRLSDPEQFGQVVVKQVGGALIRIKDIARVELAALDYSSNSYLDKDPAVAMAVFQRPGSNALATAKLIRQTMADISKRFPPANAARTAQPRKPPAKWLRTRFLAPLRPIAG